MQDAIENFRAIYTFSCSFRFDTLALLHYQMLCFKENTVNKPYLEKAKAEVFVTVICDCKKDEKC